MKKLKLFAGPCVLESHSFALKVAEELVRQLGDLSDGVDLVFKGSFDKANRTSHTSFRGPGIEEGLRILEDVKAKTGLKVVTDFHLPQQAQAVAQVVDVLQIPAFLCRQTDMIVEGAKACAQYRRVLKIKKGQFLAPSDTHQIVEKAKEHLPLEQILLTERGTSFGYHNLVVDMSSFSQMKACGVEVIHDATHCVQRPGGLGKTSGGKRENILVLARAAIAAGADGLFMEVHPNPEQALSDASTCLPLDKVRVIVGDLLKIFQCVSQLELTSLKVD